MSLLELLLSLAVMAAMALALSTVLGLMGRASLRIGEAGATAERLIDRAALRSWIEAAPRTASFEGDGGSLRFQTLADEPPLEAADLAVVSVGRDESGAVAAAIASPQGASGRRVVLTPNGGLSIRYYGRPTPSAAPEWRADWPAVAEPPDLVRIEYDGPSGAYPPLTVIPALDARQSAMSLSSPLPPS